MAKQFVFRRLTLLPFLILGSAGCATFSPNTRHEERPVIISQEEQGWAHHSHTNETAREQSQPATTRDEDIASENARLLEELRQRGIDVRYSDRGVVINLPDVLFAFGKADLTPSATEIISEIAQVLQRAPSRYLRVEGHTDSIGTIEYNYHLSLARARNVSSALESNGIPSGIITVEALGETTPIATNRNEQGRRRNRRVEVIIENR